MNKRFLNLTVREMGANLDILSSDMYDKLNAREDYTINKVDWIVVQEHTKLIKRVFRLMESTGVRSRAVLAKWRGFRG